MYERLVFLVKAALNIHPKWKVDVSFISSRRIQRLNAMYRKKNKPTDVLSFSHERNTSAIMKNPPEGQPLLGEIYLCKAVIKRFCLMKKVSMQKRIQELIIHGLCHLNGFDHEKFSDFIVMKRTELELARFIRTIK